MPDPARGSFTELTVDGFVDRARALLARPGRTMLGITGAPGSGKSTVTAALREALGAAVVVVPMDGFHLSNEILTELGRRDRKGAPDTFDVDGYVALLSRIRACEEDVYAPRFDRDLEQSIGSAQHVLATTPLVVTEGNYLLAASDGWEQVRPLLDEVWYLDVDLPEIRRRLISRREAHGHAPEAARAWVTNVDEANAHIVIESRDRADLVMRLGAQRPDHADPPHTEETKEYR